jgi:hypothetical protein
MAENKKNAAPLTDDVATALASLVGDAQSERPREPSHSDLSFLFRTHGLESVDPAQRGQGAVGKTKRVREVLYGAMEHDQEAGERLVFAIVAQVRGKGGFRVESQNFVGNEAIANLTAAFKLEGYELYPDGVLRPIVLDNLSGAELTEALKAYVRRAKTGASDAALVTGTGKDLTEAVAAHILTERVKGYSASHNFPSLLAAVFERLGLALPMPGAHAPSGEPPQRQVERTMFEMALALNRLRNKEGTGHGRSWLPTVTDAEARFAIENMGAISEFLLARHASYR